MSELPAITEQNGACQGEDDEGQGVEDARIGWGRGRLEAGGAGHRLDAHPGGVDHHDADREKGEGAETNECKNEWTNGIHKKSADIVLRFVMVIISSFCSRIYAFPCPLRSLPDRE